MGKVLYRKYRSKSLDEIIGQDHITTTLKNALKTNRISHAYLLTGPRGVGKTSVARILAYEINKIPYNETTTNIDIIEIDAASNRRIDEIRELRDKIHITPAQLTYKIYIIDEVHMLTKEAFNALLKTLEEPPEHAIFILATTEAHKLPDTIISRTQRYNFKPLSPSVIASHLKDIAKKETIKIEEEAIKVIANHGDGSFRDSINILDQVSNIYGDSITQKDVNELLGIAPGELMQEIITIIKSGKPSDVILLQNKCEELGLSAVQISKQLSQQLREKLINGESSIGRYDIAELLRNLLDIQTSSLPDDAFEIFLYEHTSNKNTQKSKIIEIEQSANRIESKSIEPEEPKKIKQPEPRSNSPAPTKANLEENSEPSTITNDSIKKMIDEGLIKNVLQELKKRHNTLYAVARLTHPIAENDQLILQCNFAFHSKQLNDAKNIKIIQQIIKDVSGQSIAVKSVTIKSNHKTSQSKPKDSDTLNTINTIFGGGELLED